MRSAAVVLLAGGALLLSVPVPALAAAPPTISKTSFSEVTETSAALAATVNPGERKVTDYHFQYITKEAFKADGNEFGEGTQSTPVGEITTELSAGHQVTASVSELIPGAAYRFRLSATNNQGTTPGETLAFATYTTPPTFGACPNDAFRTGQFAPSSHPSATLPDCRAYEQASPVQKNGVEARGRVALAKAAIDGEAVAFGAAGDLPGAEGAQGLPMYLASRGPEGWSTQGLFPPAGYGQNSLVLGWTPDFSQTIARATRLGPPGDTGLLERSSADHSITEVVPYDKGLESPELASTSEDGSEVAFETETKLLPGAAAGKPNVYAWDKKSGKLGLAGALNAPGEEGKAPTEGAFAGSYDWIAAPSEGINAALKSGGARASYYTQDAHVLSEDGGVIFTSAGEGQLYKRLNPTQPQSQVVTNGSGEEECTEAGKACTIHISASEKTNGFGTKGHDAAGTRPAAFLDASPDGSRILFSSSEKLTNDATTGPEPEHEAAIARANLADGSGVNLKFLPAHAKGIAFSGEYVYWADPTGHEIGRAKLNPGTGEAEAIEPHFIVPPETSFETHPLTEPGVMHSSPATPQYVAVDAEHVYWTNTGPIGGDREINGIKEKLELEQALAGAGTIGRAGLDGEENLVAGSIEAAFIKGAANPQGIALGPCSEGGSCIYWANEGDPPGSSAAEVATRTIGRAKLDGTEAAQGFIQVDSPGDNDRPQGLAVDGAHIYVSANGGSFHQFRTLYRYDLDGGGAVFLSDSTEANFTPGLRGIAIDSEYLYWARQGGDSIGRVPLTALNSSGNCEAIPSCEREFIPHAGGPQGLVISGSHLYWSANQEAAPNPGNDLYRYDAGAPAEHHLTDLVPDPNPAEENGAEVMGILGASKDLSSVYFVANGDLDGPGGLAQAGNCKGSVKNLGFAFSGECSLYLAREGEPIRFIARLDSQTISGATNGDGQDWTPRGGIGDQAGKSAWVSADGNAVLFLSQAKLAGYDNIGPCGAQGTGGPPVGCSELYRYEVGAPGPACVSCNPTGERPLGPGEVRLGDITLSTLVPGDPDLVLSRNLSADGKRVFFESTAPLVVGDTNGTDGCPEEGTAQQSTPSCQDVYEWEAPGSGSCKTGGPGYSVQDEGCIYLLSSGKSPRASYFLDASADGSNAFLATAEGNLVRQDQDQLFDIYDARIDGGLTSQNEPPSSPCEGEACKGASASPPPPQACGTACFQGPANPKAGKPKPHRKHRHRHRHKRLHKREGQQRYRRHR